MNTVWKDVELLTKICAETRTISEALRAMGIETLPGNYKYFKKVVKLNHIDITHFTPGRSFGPRPNRRKPLNELLLPNIYPHKRLKERLLSAGLLDNKCEGCQITEWKTSIGTYPLSLHLDHKNGDWMDNRLDNLRLLCPNCHSITDTYCGKKNRKNIAPKYCNCGKIIFRSSNRCKKCFDKEPHTTKIKWPSIAKIKSKLKDMSFEALARELGVSSNAIRKYLRKSSKEQKD